MNRQIKISTSKKFDLYKNKNAVRFHWDIITHCNYKCSYCYARAIDGNWLKITNKQTIEKILLKISKINEQTEIVLLGGEPSKHPKYFWILENIYNIKNNIYFGIISNGSYKNYKEFIDRHLPYINKFNFNITFHPDQANIEEFKQTIKYIQDSGFMLNVNIMLTTPNDDKSIRIIIKFCIDNNINFFYNILFDKDDTTIVYDSTNEYKKWISDINKKFNSSKELKFFKNDDEYIMNDIEVSLSNNNIFKNWTCYNNNYEIPVNQDKFYRMCVDEEYSVDDINSSSSVICEKIKEYK